MPPWPPHYITNAENIYFHYILNFRIFWLRENRCYRALKCVLNKTQHRDYYRNKQKTTAFALKGPVKTLYICAQQKKCETTLYLTFAFISYVKINVRTLTRNAPDRQRRG